MPIYRTLTCTISLKQKYIYIENEESLSINRSKDTFEFPSDCHFYFSTTSRSVT